MAEKRYIYANVGLSFEILDSWFGYTGDDEPTEREIEEYDYLVIGLAPDQDSADGICRRLNDQQDEINHLSNFGLHVILDKKNKEIEQLKSANSKLIVDKNGIQGEYEWLKDENEQLKSICQDHRDHAIDFKADCVRLEKENEQLKLENVRIKQTILEAYKKERTYIGRNVLKQLLEAIR